MLCVPLTDMTAALKPQYQPPMSRDMLSNTRGVPQRGRECRLQELKETEHVALTCDGWTSVAQDHFTTVTVQFTKFATQKLSMWPRQEQEFVAEETRHIMILGL